MNVIRKNMEGSGNDRKPEDQSLKPMQVDVEFFKQSRRYYLMSDKVSESLPLSYQLCFSVAYEDLSASRSHVILRTH